MSFRDSISKLEKHSHSCCCEGDTACHGHGTGEHCHDHGEEEMFDKLMLVRVLVSAVLFALAMLLPLPEPVELVMLIAAAVICGYDVYIGALVNILKKRLLDECLLMSVASIAAFVIGEDHEGAAVMLLYQIGEMLQNYAVHRTKHSVSELMDLRFNSATVLRDGAEISVHAHDVAIGDIIAVHSGERVPVDCIAPEGGVILDTSAISGDSEPVRVREGESVLSGSVNVGASFTAEAVALAENSTASRIADIVENEEGDKGSTEKFITRFARIYTPIVIAMAVLVAVLMPLLGSFTFGESIHRALVFMVVACPCALVISVPLSYFAGMAGASRHGILFRNSMAVDDVAKAKAVVFDKTGTITTGKYRVSSVKSEKMDADMLLKIAAHALAYSGTAVAKAIIESYGGTVYIELIQDYVSVPGKGVSVTVDGIPIILGSDGFLRENGVEFTSEDEEKTVYMAVSGIYAGRITLEDPANIEAKDAVSAIRDAGIYDIAMISGDSDKAGAAAARDAGISDCHIGCDSAEKAAFIDVMEGGSGKIGPVMLVAGTEAEAALLTQADVGVVMGGLGSSDAVSAAGVVIMDSSPLKVATAIKAARNMRRIIFENLVFIFGIKIAVLVLGVLGISAVWFAVFADVGVALAASLNSIRAYYIKNPNN